MFCKHIHIHFNFTTFECHPQRSIVFFCEILPAIMFLCFVQCNILNLEVIKTMWLLIKLYEQIKQLACWLLPKKHMAFYGHNRVCQINNFSFLMITDTDSEWNKYQAEQKMLCQWKGCKFFGCLHFIFI